MSTADKGSPDARTPAGGRRWLFGAAEFDERTLELRVGGQLMELERKSLEVLMLLLYRAGEVVTKDELLESVWPGRVLSETVPAKCVSRIREALGDEDQQAVIKTVHGYGYRLIAPVKVETTRAPSAPRLNLAAGEHPPLRPLWSLVEQLGAGGQGEVWLVRHDKTREQRVYKFALNAAGLAALKREITLYRYLRDTLGNRDEFVNVLDWNLEEAPYFLEMEYAGGGNLDSWGHARGGMANVALGVRLEIVAKIADALAAAHSVGVLHKDLKPSNVLILTTDAAVPGVKLTDFGSGGILDPKRLEALGITRLGFTQSIVAGELAATALYLAPEVMTGQPATVQADVYSLGVVLYQMVVGDLKRPLSSGWELTIGDPLLSEDIALAVAGDPALRLSDAASLANRLRTLEARRRERSEEQTERLRLEAEKQAAKEQARKAELALARLRARRNWMVTAAAALIAGTIISLGLYVDARRSRDEAAAAAATSQAVADFLSKDMFAAVGSRPLRDFTIPELLEAASAVLPERMKQQPAAAAQVNAALGSAFLTMEMMEAAEKHLDPALAAYKEMGTPALLESLTTATQLVHVKFMLGKLPALLPQYQHLLKEGQHELGRAHPVVLIMNNNLANAQITMGEWRQGAESLRRLIEDANSSQNPDQAVIGSAQMQLGSVLVQLGKFSEAAEILRSAIVRLSTHLDPNHLSVGHARLFLGHALIELEQFQDADSELSRATEIFDRWFRAGPNSNTFTAHGFRGLLSLRQGRPGEAVSRLATALAAVESLKSSLGGDHFFVHRSWLALAFREAGRLAEAHSNMQMSLLSAESLYGPRHPFTQGVRVGLADILRLQGRLADSRQVLVTVDAGVFADLSADHPLMAELHRAQGLLAMAEDRQPEARRELEEALRIFELQYGFKHLFTRRAREELAQVRSPTG